LDAGKNSAVIGLEFALEEVRAAFARSASGRAGGMNVVATGAQG